MTQPSAALSAQFTHISLPSLRFSPQLWRKKCALASLGNASAVKRALNELVMERKMPHRFRLQFNPGCLIALSHSLMPFQPAFSYPETGLTGWPHKQGMGKANYWSNWIQNSAQRNLCHLAKCPQMLASNPESQPGGPPSWPSSKIVNALKKTVSIDLLSCVILGC